MHARRAPEVTVLRNTTVEGALPLRDRPSAAAARSGSPRPVPPETSTVPAQQGIGAEDSQGVETVRPQPVVPNPEEALFPAETEPSAVPMGNHGQLLPQRQDQVGGDQESRPNPIPEPLPGDVNWQRDDALCSPRYLFLFFY